MYRTALALDS
jgi:tetratricopeptide (TPR) repeat protein